MDTTNLVICENRFPNLLRMELEIKPLNEYSFKLLANIRFGQYTIRTNNYGEVTFGLRKGKLKVELDKGVIPLKNIKLGKGFQKEVEIKVLREEEKEQQSELSIGWKAGAAVKNVRSIGKEFLFREYQVRFEGELTHPCWVFEAKSEKILEGFLMDTELAIVDVMEKPCLLIATFTIENMEDICLIDSKFLGIKNITKKKLAIVERWIAKYWLAELLKDQPYLSRIKLTNE